MTDFIERKCEFDRSLSGQPPTNMKPSTGETLTSLFPELQYGQVLLINEKDQEETIGFAMYALRYYGLDAPPSLWLHALFVDPTQRSQGAGKALMEELAHISEAAFCSHLGWKCHILNLKGQNFYNRMGATVESQKGDLYSYQWVPTTRAAATTGAATA
jgi:GNAT superfamily N-acetyltransferase